MITDILLKMPLTHRIQCHQSILFNDEKTAVITLNA